MPTTEYELTSAAELSDFLMVLGFIGLMAAVATLGLLAIGEDDLINAVLMIVGMR